MKTKADLKKINSLNISGLRTVNQVMAERLPFSNTWKAEEVTAMLRQIQLRIILACEEIIGLPNSTKGIVPRDTGALRTSMINALRQNGAGTAAIGPINLTIGGPTKGFIVRLGTPNIVYANPLNNNTECRVSHSDRDPDALRHFYTETLARCRAKAYDVLNDYLREMNGGRVWSYMLYTFITEQDTLNRFPGTQVRMATPPVPLFETRFKGRDE
jgi:hypothetical protein